MTEENSNWIRVELHCHTSASADSLVPYEEYLARCEKVGIDKLAITDHNMIEAALAAKAVASEMVIVGEEIKTELGELIGYFMSEWIPPGLSPMETIQRLRDQGAVISIPHPFDPIRGRDWKPGDLETIVPYVDAIETFNARCLGQKANLEAAAFANKNGLLETVGSDAHTVDELGVATLTMPDFSDSQAFIESLDKAVLETKLSPFYTHFYSNFAKFSKLLRKIITNE
jgi:predicted metal-dependent phosphoesterase TrpH